MNRDWDNAYPPMPKNYHTAMMDTLNHLEETSMKRKHKVTMTLVAVIAIIFLMGTVALAAMNHFGILDFFDQGPDPLKPLPGIEQLIQKDLGSTQSELLRLSIREALYDGAGIRVVAAIEPIDQDKYAVVNDTDSEVTEGRIPIVLESAVITSSNTRIVDDGYVPLDQYVMEDSSFVFSAECLIEDNAPDVIELNVALNGDSEATALSVSVELYNRADTRTVQLEPVSREEDFRILNAELKFTQLAAYLELTYEDYRPAPTDEPFDAPDGTYYGSLMMRFYHSNPECSGMADAQAHDLAEFEERGIKPCPVCIDDAPFPATLKFIQFTPLNEDGSEVKYSGYSIGQIGDEMDGVRTYHQSMMLQTSDELPAALYLKPMETTDTIDKEYDAIECRITK